MLVFGDHLLMPSVDKSEIKQFIEESSIDLGVVHADSPVIELPTELLPRDSSSNIAQLILDDRDQRVSLSLGNNAEELVL